ncbi:MAG: class I SAM-dependent methyltransferase [Nitrospina sp.]|jgi:ubiquinone/menaquinone biosynthesis C-methylase UbiE|nr:class I SAM-dependent methyltransferase [Nitrospina sp.]MBT3510497.1 class I SAM-dependent methyltransferase [Nitrospina sp.]MBT3875742.1 class I SAM-dependent methyltransferase [Nitrospina sp.]MBT4049189.1 class I SAM-dependent methyltransferase [Nitrospina sp.]MBT4557158.1 class I SAM-dependent methyltransferase [Nitrospina sp.]
MAQKHWDYTELADAYLKRPDYADDAINNLLKTTNLPSGSLVCDIGAGVAHLTIKLAERGLNILAVEPNLAMRKHGINRTAHFKNVSWAIGTGEHTEQLDQSFDLVTFGSSFNVTDRNKALIETKRILKPLGWFACMWNHRDLTDPIQQEIEATIKKWVPQYDYGARREDQTPIIEQSNFFSPVIKTQGSITYTQDIEDCIEAWRSHGTLERQATNLFPNIVSDIEKLLKGKNLKNIQIPYTTKIWMAQLKT